MTSTSRMTREQMGLLTIKNKSYPIYEGLNVVGRDLKASVLVNDEKFSRQHAIISVLDENTHLVSDFGSSNGTRLGNRYLIPYKLYRINDQERITFSDVECIYQKMAVSCKLVQHSFVRTSEESCSTESQFNRYEAPTQALPGNTNKPPNASVVNNLNDSHTMHLAPTQKIFNIHDAPKDIFKEPQNSDINANTSMTDNDDFIPSTQDCDKPTQQLHTIFQGKSSDTAKQSTQNLLKFVPSTQDDCFSHTECYDDVLANETFHLSMKNHLNINVEVDETVFVHNISHIASDNETIDKLNTEQISNQCAGDKKCVGMVTQKSEICDQKRTEPLGNKLKSTEIDTEICKESMCENSDKKCDNSEKRIENDEKNKQVKNVTKEHNDDSETDIEQNDSKPNGESKIISDKVSDDSETDMENNDLKRNKKSTGNKDADDSETDVERNNPNIRKQIDTKRDDDSETDIDDKINKGKLTRRRKLRKQLNVDPKKISDYSETDIEDSAEIKSKPKKILLKKVQFIHSDSETDMEENKNLENIKNNKLTSINNENEISIVNKKNVDNDSGSETELEDEDILLKIKNIDATSLNKCESAAKPTTQDKKDVPEAACYSSEEEMDLLAPTQKLTRSFSDKIVSSDKCRISLETHGDNSTVELQKSVLNAGLEDDEFDLLVPTQLLNAQSLEQKSSEQQIAEAETQLLETVRKPMHIDNHKDSCKDINTLAPTQRLDQVATTSGGTNTNEGLYSLAPRQLLESLRKSSDIIKDEAETNILEPVSKSSDTDNNEERIEDAETQLEPIGKPVATNKCEEISEEIGSVASTQLLQSLKKSSDTKKQEVAIENAETKLFEPVRKSTDNKKQEEQSEDLNILCATKLLEQVRYSAKENNSDEEIDYLAPTQLLQPTDQSSDREQNEEDEGIEFLAPTQLLQLTDCKTTRKEENNEVYLAATQLLLPMEDVDKVNVSKKGESVFLAPPQKLLLQNKSNTKKAGPQEVDFEDSDEEISFLAPTQKLSLDNKKSQRKSVSFSEDIFSVPTQKLSEIENTHEAIKVSHETNDDKKEADEDQPEEHSIFSGPTQKLSLSTRKSLGMKHKPEENDDDDDEDFMAPTQLLKTNKNEEKSSKAPDLDFSYTDDPHYINVDYSSEDTSMNLAISYNPDDEDFMAPTQKLELPKTIPADRKNEGKSVKLTEVPTNVAKLPEPETQLEVEFALDTQKLYVETATSRPNNPLANMFDEENTEITETEDVISHLVDTVSSKKKTESDTDQTLSSNIETSDSSFQEQSRKRSFAEDNAETVIKKSKRNVKQNKEKTDVVEMDNIRRTSKRAETINSKYSKANILNKDVTQEATSTPKKRGRKVEKKEENSSEKETKVQPTTSGVQSKVNLCDEKHTEKEKGSKLCVPEENPDTPRRMSTRGGRKTEERELVTPRKTTERRGKKMSDSKLESHSEDQQEEENVKTIEQITNTNIPQIKLVLSEDIESKTEGEVYKKPSEGLPVPKRETRRTNKRSETAKNANQEMKTTRITRNKSNSNEESTDFGSSKENISELGDFVSTTRKLRPAARKTKVKQTRKKFVPDDEEEPVTIEDSDDSTNSNIEEYIRKQVLKVDYTDESCSGSSGASTVVPNPRHNKRSLKIEDYTSDDSSSKNEIPNANSYNSVCDTPNTKRRKYEPLNVTTINSSQSSNSESGSGQHKVVFTMLNNPELETVVKTLGGTTVDSVYTCTVLVTNKISRSLKFLIAVSLGKPIVGTKWISESAKKKMFLNPWDYLLEDQESENKFQVCLKESLLRAKIKKLLTGYTVLLVVNRNFDVLKEIIETCGGKCVTRAPAKSTGANVVVVAYEDEKSKYSRYLKQRTVVSAEAIFSGVLSQKLYFEDHLLS